MLAELASWLQASGAWAPLAFVAAYVAGSIALIPGSALTLVAGAVFGLARGIPIVFAGAVLGSSAAFAIGRTVARAPVARWLARDNRAAAVDEAIGSEGLRVVLLLRLSPVFPYAVLNYALGVSRVRYRDFLLGSIGMLPGTVLYTYYGTLAGDVVALAAGTAPPRGAGYYGLLAAGLAATLLATAIISRAARRALERRPGR